MDWQGTSGEANKTVELAVVKVEATVPVTDPSYGGAVVLNPGTLQARSLPFADCEAQCELMLLRRRTGRLGHRSSPTWRPQRPHHTFRWTGN